MLDLLLEVGEGCLTITLQERKIRKRTMALMGPLAPLPTYSSSSVLGCLPQNSILLIVCVDTQTGMCYREPQAYSVPMTLGFIATVSMAWVQLAQRRNVSSEVSTFEIL